ncbi:MAG: hypothetical protein GEU80_16015 [Dehalococcoidia bacterium]|nr:hypothetical protein [Dehalococcoidia bacterium]
MNTNRDGDDQASPGLRPGFTAPSAVRALGRPSRARLALGIAALALVTQVALFALRADAEDVTLSCVNYQNELPAWTAAARHFAQICGHDAAPPDDPASTVDTDSGTNAGTGAATGADLRALEGRLEQLMASTAVGGEYALAVTDLQTGETISVNGDEWHLSGCSINFFVILRAVLDVQEGRYAESRVGDLISRTVYSSNPVTGLELYRITGSGDVLRGIERTQALARQLGLERVILDHAPLFKHAGSTGEGPDNWLTAADANEALAAVYRTDLLTAEWREYLLEKMSGVKPGLQYLTGYGNGGVTSHKNGFFPTTAGWYVDNDIGIVRFTRGGETYAYAISYLGQRIPTQYAQLGLFQQASQQIWEHFSQRYP